MKLQPKWLRQATRDADEAFIRQDDLCNEIMDDKYTTFESHPKYETWLRATILTERAMEHAKRMEFPKAVTPP